MNAARPFVVVDTDESGNSPVHAPTPLVIGAIAATGGSEIDSTSASTGTDINRA